MSTWISRAAARLGVPPRAGRPAPRPEVEPDVPAPPQCDWAWRPTPWRGGATPPDGPLPEGRIAPDAEVFHDGDPAALRLTAASSGLSLHATGFAGGFVSVALALPDAARATMAPGHIVAVRLEGSALAPIRLDARLNLRDGPNVEPFFAQVDLTPAPGAATAEFDLGMGLFRPGRLGAAWLDLIVPRPRDLAVTLSDLTVTRRPRAEL